MTSPHHTHPDFYNHDAQHCTACSARLGRAIWHLLPLCATTTDVVSKYNIATAAEQAAREWLDRECGSWQCARKGSVDALAAIIAKHLAVGDVEAALAELREMFPGEPVSIHFYDYSEVVGCEGNGYVSATGAAHHTAGATLSEAMQRVREWKVAEPKPSSLSDYLMASCTESECRLCRTPLHARTPEMKHSGISSSQ